MSAVSGVSSSTSRASSAVSARGSYRRPTVRGFPVSVQTGSAPSDSSHASASSSRSQTSRCSSASPAGHSLRKSSHSRWRQTTPLDSSIEPPAPRSLLDHARPQAELARPRRGDETGHPGAGDDQLRSARTSACARRTRCGRASGPAEEDRVRVRRVDDVVDLDAELVRRLDVLLGRVDEDGEVVEQRPLGSAGVALLELDVGAADLDARTAGRAGRRRARSRASVYSSAVAAGSAERSATWSRSYSTRSPPRRGRAARPRPGRRTPRRSAAGRARRAAAAAPAPSRGPRRAARRAAARPARAAPRPRTASASRGARPTRRA